MLRLSRLGGPGPSAGTVGSDAKAEAARAHGCDHTIVYTREDFAPAVKELTGGEGVHAVYDSIGKDTFEGSLSCLRPLGLMAQFGEASGEPPLVSPRVLGTLGSVYLTHPSLPHYTATRADFETSAKDLFEVVDRWGNPYAYFNCVDYERPEVREYLVDPDGAEDYEVVQVKPWMNEKTKSYYNQTGFQLFSAGPDRVFNTEDDIGNW